MLIINTDDERLAKQLKEAGANYATLQNAFNELTARNIEAINGKLLIDPKGERTLLRQTSEKDKVAQQFRVAQVKWNGIQEGLEEQVTRANQRARDETKRRREAETELATERILKEAAVDQLKLEIAEKEPAVVEMNTANKRARRAESNLRLIQGSQDCSHG